MCKKIIIGPAYPLRGGISESNESLCQAFIEKGDTCKIISYKLQYPNFLFPGKAQFIKDQSIKTSNSIRLINTLNPFSWISAAKFIIGLKPDYVIVRYWHPYFALCLGLIARIIFKKNISLVAWIDNIDPHESVPFQSFLTSFFLSSFNNFIVMSEDVKRNLLKYNFASNKNIIVSSHPVYDVFGRSINKNIARKKLSSSGFFLNENDKCILFFGLIRKYKGLNMLLDVMSSKKIQAMNIKLIIAREFYDKKEKYIQKIKNFNLEKSVLVHDFYIPNQDVVNYFCAVDIVVQPYLSATQSGVSMVAYNFNKPIILTNVGGLSEYVDHKVDGYLVDVNKESIILALEDFYVQGREQSFVNAIKSKKHLYSWENLANNFDKIYKIENNR